MTGFVTIFVRDIRRYLRFKHQLFSSLLQPVLWLAFFGVAMAGNFDRILADYTGVEGVPNVNYLTFICAGIISATILFTNVFGGFFVMFDKKWGLMREVMASPVKRHEVILGLCLSAIVKSWIQALLVVVFGLILGVNFWPDSPLITVVLSIPALLIFIIPFCIAFLCLSITIALRVDSPEGFQAITALLTMPLFFLSNSLYSIDGFPPLFKYLAELNPLTHLITGVRYCIIGSHFTATGSEFIYSLGDILLSFGYLVLIAAIAYLVAVIVIEKAEVT